MGTQADQSQETVEPIKISDSQSDAEILKVKCDFFGFEFEIESQQDKTIQLNQVPGWTDYSFSAQTNSEGSELLVWKSDLNEGNIDLFNGVLEFTANLLNDGNRIGTKKTCSVVPKSNEANSAFIKRKNKFLQPKSEIGLVDQNTDVVSNEYDKDASSHIQSANAEQKRVLFQGKSETLFDITIFIDEIFFDIDETTDPFTQKREVTKVQGIC